MFRNILAAMLRHLSRSKLQAGIAVGGLAVGLCATLLAALVIRNQFSHDHDLPGYERVWIALAVFAPPGVAPQYGELTEMRTASRLRERFPQVEAVTRVIDESMRVQVGPQRHWEQVAWADANLFEVLPLRTLAGDGHAALQAADGVILTRAEARRHFSQDAPLGQTMLIDGHPMTVRAILEDVAPRATHKVRGIIASANAGFSPTRRNDRPEAANLYGGYVIAAGLTYLRLKEGAGTADLHAALPELVKPPDGVPAMLGLELVRIDRLNQHEGLHPGFHARMQLLAVLGGVVLLIAGVNFVNLQTARATRRGREVAIRKLAGAARGTLVLQFLGEALVHSFVATLLALALAEWLLPHLNAFLDTGAALDYRRDPALIAALLCICLFVGGLAGAWPAFVVSAGRPVSLLRGGTASSHRGFDGRQVLVAVQFALLIGLAICAGVVHQQRNFALHEAMRVNHDQVLMVLAPRAGAVMNELRQVPGIIGLTRSDVNFLGSFGYEGMRGISLSSWTDKDGRTATASLVATYLDLFDFYGIEPLAGRLPKVSDQRPAQPPRDRVVINETASRLLGFQSPAEAVDQRLPIGAPGRPSSPDDPSDARVLAVVPDFSLGPVSESVMPMIYFQPEGEPELINVRLSGRQIPETLAAVDALLVKHEPAMNGARPRRFFLDEHFERQYRSVLRQSQAFGLCALVAVVLSCIGLLALTAASAQRRTREIGVRKALGAQTPAILRLLLWQFTRPVAWAVLLACPITAWAMQRWLDGFAYRIDLPLWLFPAAGLAALLIALLTVSAHSVRVARARPVAALRHE